MVAKPLKSGLRTTSDTRVRQLSSGLVSQRASSQESSATLCRRLSTYINLDLSDVAAGLTALPSWGVRNRGLDDEEEEAA